jgi:hypothetical protein
MHVRTLWRVKLAGKHRLVQLFHNVADGSGAVVADLALRQCFGPRVAPTSSVFTFDLAGRSCIVRIQLTDEQRYYYECEVNGTVLVADADRSVPSKTLLRPSDVPSAQIDQLLRAASAGSATRDDELLLPHSDTSSNRETR